MVAAVAVCLGAAACGGSGAASLQVVLDADALTCEGTRVKTIEVSRYNHNFTTPALEIRKDMHCVLEFSVVNAGDSGVVLDTAFVAGVGPGAGAGVRAVELSPLGEKPRQDESRPTDAVFSLDSYPLDAGDAEAFAVILTYHRGCTSPRGNVNFSDSPVVTTEHGAEAAVTGPAYAFVGTEDSNCDQ